MLRDIITLGDKIDVKHLDRNGKPVHNAKTYVSQLVDFVDSDVINIATPIDQGRIIILNVGENYNLCFYSKNSLYQCNCLVLSNFRENNTVIAVVRITTNLEKYQRRQYYRLECIHEIVYHIISYEEEILVHKLKEGKFNNQGEQKESIEKLSVLANEWLPASVTDISGGGVRCSSSVQLNQGDKIRVKLDFINPTSNPMVIGAVVVSTNRNLNRTGMYEHRIEFQDIAQKDRDQIIKYIFEQERKRRKNQ
jgi:c-di-GMP-binding flagellar brake protein YcgR